METMAWRNEGRIFIVVHTERSPSNLEWARNLNEFRAQTPADVRVIVYSRGGGPDGRQRAALNELLKVRQVPAAILTRSPLVRAVGTAISWFNRSMKMFAYDAHDEAFAFLGFTGDERERAIALRQELEARLGLPDDGGGAPRSAADGGD